MNNEDESLNLSSLLDKYKIPIGLSLVGLVLIIGGVFATTKPEKKDQASIYPEKSIVNPNIEYVAIDISGAIEKAGVYKLQQGSRIEDVINLAGGFAEDANQEYISKYLNLAQKVSDGMKIYIPNISEEVSGSMVSQGTVAGSNTSSKVNINLATQAELEALPGIGQVTASKIISARPFSKIEDLLDQKIVSKSTFEKIKDSLSTF